MRFNTLAAKIEEGLGAEFNLLTANIVGSSVLGKSILPKNKKASSISLLERAFKFGLGTVSLSSMRRASLTSRESSLALAQNLSSDEAVRLDFIASLAKAELGYCRAEYIKLLTERISKALSQDLLKSARYSAYGQSLLKGELSEALTTTGKATGSAWLRTVNTAINDAFQEGRLAGILRKGAEDPLVYKRPKNDACEWCKALYLESDGKTPIVFKSSMLRAFGTNAGRKHNTPDNTDWAPTVGSVHPWCRCTIYELPKGHAFDSSGRATQGGLW